MFVITIAVTQSRCYTYGVTKMGEYNTREIKARGTRKRQYKSNKNTQYNKSTIQEQQNPAHSRTTFTLPHSGDKTIHTKWCLDKNRSSWSVYTTRIINVRVKKGWIFDKIKPNWGCRMKAPVGVNIDCTCDVCSSFIPFSKTNLTVFTEMTPIQPCIQCNKFVLFTKFYKKGSWEFLK